jgi:Fe-S cluster biogenesis protein NfuA
MKEKVQAALEKIRPALQADGGDVELVDVKDGIVKVKLTGHCSGCRVLKEQVPEVKEVVSA